MAATWPGNPTRNGPNPRVGLTVNPPAFDADEDHSKTAEELAVEQQWRDVKALKLNSQVPNSLNHDASFLVN